MENVFEEHSCTEVGMLKTTLNTEQEKERSALQHADHNVQEENAIHIEESGKCPVHVSDGECNQHPRKRTYRRKRTVVMGQPRHNDTQSVE